MNSSESYKQEKPSAEFLEQIRERMSEYPVLKDIDLDTLTLDDERLWEQIMQGHADTAVLKEADRSIRESGSEDRFKFLQHAKDVALELSQRRYLEQAKAKGTGK